MDILSRLKKERLYFDGGYGTLLQARGLPKGELPERWNITRPEVIKEIPAVAGLTNQKVSPLMNQMVEGGLLVKTTEKRRSYFQRVG